MVVFVSPFGVRLRKGIEGIVFFRSMDLLWLGISSVGRKNLPGKHPLAEGLNDAINETITQLSVLSWVWFYQFQQKSWLNNTHSIVLSLSAPVADAERKEKTQLPHLTNFHEFPLLGEMESWSNLVRSRVRTLPRLANMEVYFLFFPCMFAADWSLGLWVFLLKSSLGLSKDIENL